MHTTLSRYASGLLIVRLVFRSYTPEIDNLTQRTRLVRCLNQIRDKMYFGGATSFDLIPKSNEDYTYLPIINNRSFRSSESIRLRSVNNLVLVLLVVIHYRYSMIISFLLHIKLRKARTCY